MQMEASSSAAQCLLAPLINFIHGDVVLEDACCQKVASALISAHEGELKALVLAQVLPSGLRKAIETYYVRGYLLGAPELLQQSAVVVQTLQQLAEVLRDASVLGQEEYVPVEAPNHSMDQTHPTPHAFLSSAGASITEDVEVLQHQHDNAHLAHLINALGDAVVGYMMHASDQCAQQAADYLNGTTRKGSGFAGAAYLTSLQHFATSAAAHRDARRRAREAAQEAEVQALLFGDSTNGATATATALAEEDAGRINEEEERPRNTAAASSPPPPSPPEVDTALCFASEVLAAMEDALAVPESQTALQQQQQQYSQQQLLKRSISSCAHKGRLLQPLNDSVQEQYTALVQTTPLPTPHQRSRSHSMTDGEAAEGSSGGAPTVLSGNDERLSPNIVVDPSTLTVEMSAVLSPPRYSGNSSSAESAVPLHAPAHRQHRADPVLIGASETSVLRMIENAAVSTEGLSSGSTTSSVPLAAQPQELIGGTPFPPFSISHPLPAVDDAREGARRCARRQEAESRSYFLCRSTNRFEPYAARGFFPE
ncbi:hypothetical protein ABB37_05427 [Leptomonas pyrrhocoris]|uniref:Uncharacterized protein n=1 Tax=Leptomonas pyrrhocoris TaxID=157538 RepID=A0A0M9G040_LEPPY|nr:hypothetical protein ABB37_05427 [Leptomonas pyrrhocoris]KPA79635.1 hypothetical protein ABB37_05427 [Leptomonas pyrrhocoris]|eukprot:XP_015658074.1 hypothetical protein ABB37_05427 [Leptomonas pyrrhocoris]